MSTLDKYFDRHPEALELSQAVTDRITCEFQDVKMNVGKSQVSFSNKYLFAAISAPLRKVKGRPEVYIVVSFGLNRREDDPRIVEAVEPYPGRWTHHVIVESVQDIDEQLMEWIREAYDFANKK